MTRPSTPTGFRHGPDRRAIIANPDGWRQWIGQVILTLMDYASSDQALEIDPNPFAMVVLAHLKTLETRRSLADRYAWKLRLVKGLYERGMDPEGLRNLFRFIDWIMDLPTGREQLFWQEITAYQQERLMPFVTIAERVGMEKGLEMGRVEGKEMGRVEGKEMGRVEGIRECLDPLIRVKFGVEGLVLMSELGQIHDLELLRAVLRAIPAAATPDELRQVWKGKRRSKKAKSE